MGVTGDNSRGPAQITVGASADCGVTFGAFVNITTGAAGYSTGPTPVLEKDGRLWRAFERNDGAWPSGYSTLAVSAICVLSSETSRPTSNAKGPCPPHSRRSRPTR